MRIRSIIILGISGLALAACAGKVLPPAIAYDSANFTAAVTEPEPPAPVEVAATPEPLALPTPEKSPSMPVKADKKPTARVEAANKAALKEPTSHGYLNAVQVYPFTDGALFRLYASPDQVSDIALERGETLSAVSAGDTVRWVVGDTTSGTGDSRRVHVLVKPFAPDLKTNLVIATDRRTYHLQLESTAETSMAMVSWTYPQDALIALHGKVGGGLPIDTQISLENIRFRYAITGDSPPWKPIRVFDDGTKAYIEFPERLDQGEAPPLFIVGADGNNQLVNYRKRSNYYVVDRLFAAAELRLGQKPQQVVRITRTDTVASNGGSASRSIR
jgi:P-type conjugative transfer protein TrbG